MIDLQPCSPAAMRAWRHLAPRLPLPFGLLGAACMLDLAGPPPPDDWVPLQAKLGAQWVAVRLSPALLPSAAVARLPELPALGLPAGLRTLLADVLVGELVDGVAGLGGPERPEVSPSEPGPLPDTLPHRLAVLREGRPAAALAFDDAGLGWLASQLRPAPLHACTLDALPVHLDLLLDRATLPARELRAAEVGDVVLLDESSLGLDGGMAVLVPLPGLAAGLRGRVADGRLHLVSILDGLMDKTPPPLAATLDDMPLPVEFLVGRLALPLSRLKELAPGQVLDLGLDVTAAVTLRVNGQVIAEGELVRIAERTGVRISSVHLARG